MILMSLGPIIAIGAVVLLVIILVGWFISTRNKFIRMDQDVENSLSRIDVYLSSFRKLNGFFAGCFCILESDMLKLLLG